MLQCSDCKNLQSKPGLQHVTVNWYIYPDCWAAASLMMVLSLPGSTICSEDGDVMHYCRGAWTSPGAGGVSRTRSLFGWPIRFVVGSWRNIVDWFIWEKNIILAENLWSFTTSHSQTNRLSVRDLCNEIRMEWGFFFQMTYVLVRTCYKYHGAWSVLYLRHRQHADLCKRN